MKEYDKLATEAEKRGDMKLAEHHRIMAEGERKEVERRREGIAGNQSPCGGVAGADRTFAPGVICSRHGR